MNSLSHKIIIEAHKARVKTFEDFQKIKRSIHKENKGFKFPSNIALLSAYRKLVVDKVINPQKELEKLLITKKMRSLSGVSVITVATKPYPCPGKCIYCPTEKDVPKSYLSNEPAIMRAILCGYDAKKQVEARLKSLSAQGHATDKIEIIIIGGTFSYLPKKYQEEFVKECFDTLNNQKSRDLEEAQRLNEKAGHRMVGLTLETRPDYIDEKEIEWFRYLGATRVELGAQSLDDEILKINKRGHDVKKTKEATKLLKDAGFKICYHMMPNLYGSNLKKDIVIFRELFSNPAFRPDYIKIYPCMVIEGTELYELWKKNKYYSYSDEELYKLLKEIKKEVPYYVRIKRLIRDIPSVSIASGSKLSNMRQVLEDSKIKENWECRCIRCREVKGGKSQGNLKMFREDYDASGGKEIFLSYENQNRTQLYSLLRLRFAKGWTLGELKGAALIREVHTYGQEISVGEKGDASQHKGLGVKLIKEAEKISKEEFNLKKIAVISGVGVRGYYQKLGYELSGSYMEKEF